MRLPPSAPSSGGEISLAIVEDVRMTTTQMKPSRRVNSAMVRNAFNLYPHTCAPLRAAKRFLLQVGIPGKLAGKS
jgi:hypothetical protein